MKGIKNIEWINPKERIWGFHLHQELPKALFPLAVVVQKQCANFLTQHHITIDASDCIKPGYGPHLDYMWELRVENLQHHVLESMGLSISYLAINHFNLGAYIHPLMQDKDLPEQVALKQEGHYNQKNALWFSKRVVQNQDFFFNPPINEKQQIIDTRTPRIMSAQEITNLYAQGLKEFSPEIFKDPYSTIVNGYHIHMDYQKEEEELALAVFENFNHYLNGIHLIPTSTRVYKERENGPHLQRGWEVKFETPNQSILKNIGIAIGWLMCNRQGLPLFIHPVTWQEGDHKEELNAHQNYAFFIDKLPELWLDFFSNKIADKVK